MQFFDYLHHALNTELKLKGSLIHKLVHSLTLHHALTDMEDGSKERRNRSPGSVREAVKKKCSFNLGICAPTILEFWVEKEGGLTKSKIFGAPIHVSKKPILKHLFTVYTPFENNHLKLIFLEMYTFGSNPIPPFWEKD